MSRSLGDGPSTTAQGRGPAYTHQPQPGPPPRATGGEGGGGRFQIQNARARTSVVTRSTGGHGIRSVPPTPVGKSSYALNPLGKAGCAPSPAPALAALLATDDTDFTDGKWFSLFCFIGAIPAIRGVKPRLDLGLPILDLGFPPSNRLSPALRLPRREVREKKLARRASAIAGALSKRSFVEGQKRRFRTPSTRRSLNPGETGRLSHGWHGFH